MAVNTIYWFTYHANDSVALLLVAVPDLFSTLISFCGDDELLKNSANIVEYIDIIAINLSMKKRLSNSPGGSGLGRSPCEGFPGQI